MRKKEKMQEQTEMQERTGCTVIDGVIAVRPANEEGKEWFLTVGKHRASKKVFKAREEAMAYAAIPRWDTMIAVVAEMIEIKKEKEV